MNQRILGMVAMMISMPAVAMAVESGEAALSKEDWACAQATSSALQGPLTTAGLIDENKVDNTRTEIKRLAKEALAGGKGSRQVFLLTLHEARPSTRQLSFIETSETREGECPARDSVAYVISQQVH